MRKGDSSLRTPASNVRQSPRSRQLHREVGSPSPKPPTSSADLQGADLLAVDEDEGAVVEFDSPSARGARDPIPTDFDRLPRAFPEVLDDHAALLLVRAWKNHDRGIYRERIRCGFALPAVDSFGHISPLSARPNSVDHELAGCR